MREKHYHWQWHLTSSPDDLWPLITDLNRFNRDMGMPPAILLDDDDTDRENAHSHVRQQMMMGITVEYTQTPYEWVYPHRYSLARRYKNGPIADMHAQIVLAAHPDGGTQLDYTMRVQARNLIGVLMIPFQIGRRYRRRLEHTLYHYDQLAASDTPSFTSQQPPSYAPGGRDRLHAVRQTLLDEGADSDLLAHLIDTIEHADPLTLSRLRPYALADYWHADRQAVLKLCLVATRFGLLDFRWDLLCPLCRNPQDSSPTLGSLKTEEHCPVCHIDFEANFERSVELTFRPNPAIRPTETATFCVGWPQSTPHIVTQQLLAPGQHVTVQPTLESGRYRLRALDVPGGQYLRAEHDGSRDITLALAGSRWPEDEITSDLTPRLELANQAGQERLFILERIAWTDQAVTASEVTMLQMFRDLFASEALRPGEQISVGKLAIVFTDLRDSTRLYREIGDAPAFGLVMSHFDVLRAAIIAEGGVVVKTLGDSIMGAFSTPLAAIRAVMQAQHQLEHPPAGRPLSIKAGIHYGPAIAVTLNKRLDYFGSSVNVAARLETLSQGNDVIVSNAVCHDPEVAAWLDDPANRLHVEPVRATLKGFERDHFELWRIKRESD
jgi:adenylate cyclase